MTSDTKRCRRCDRDRPRTAFYRASDTRDGLRRECKECKDAHTAEYRRRNPRRMTFARPDGVAFVDPTPAVRADWQWGSPCRADASHIADDGMTPRYLDGRCIACNRASADWNTRGYGRMTVGGAS